jgi:hypothetical protein
MFEMSRNSSVDEVSENTGEANIRNDPTLELNSLFIGTITSPTTSSSWFVSVGINRTQVRFKLDPGAEANVLPFNVYSSLKIGTSLQKTDVALHSYGNFNVKAEGKVFLRCVINGQCEMLPFFVVTVQSTTILCVQVCEKLNLVKKVNEVAPSPSTKEHIIHDYPEVFERLGSMDGEYHIVVDKTVKPVIHRPRKVNSISILGKLKEKHSQLEKIGVVQKVDKPNPYVNSLVIIEKRDGSLRLCLDPHNLKKAIQREHHRIDLMHNDVTSLDAREECWSE